MTLSKDIDTRYCRGGSDCVGVRTPPAGVRLETGHWQQLDAKKTGREREHHGAQCVKVENDVMKLIDRDSCDESNFGLPPW